MVEIKHFRIYCLTENAWVNSWGIEIPTKCNNDHNHIVNNESVQEIEYINNEIIEIKEENIKTGGHLQMDSHTFDIPAGATGSITIYESSYPCPVNILSMTICPTADNIGDSINADVGHDTTIGYLIRNENLGTTMFEVSSSVINYLKLGYLVSLSDTIITNNLGRCIMIDTINNRISTEYAATPELLASQLIYVKQTIQMIRNLDFPYSTLPIEIGSNKIGASYVPKNVIGRIKYKNNNGLPKTFTFYIEYLY